MIGFPRCGSNWLVAASVVALLLLWRQQALGLATEQFGNAPVSTMFPSFTADLLPVLNDPAGVGCGA